MGDRMWYGCTMKTEERARKCRTPGCDRDTQREGNPWVFAYCVACTSYLLAHRTEPPFPSMMRKGLDNPAGMG
jgi:hypothetical protein